MSWRPERVRQHGKDEAVEEGGETEDWARHLSRALELNFLVSLSIYLSISLSLSVSLSISISISYRFSRFSVSFCGQVVSQVINVQTWPV